MDFTTRLGLKIQGDEILFAQETERVSRKKFDAQLGFNPKL